MSEVKPLRLYSKSAVQTDWKCERSYYYNYCYEGKGIVSSNTSLELYIGTTLHDSLAAIALQHMAGAIDIDLVASTAQQQMLEALGPLFPDNPDFVKEQSALVEGTVRGFHRHVWPRLLAQYPTVKLVEQALIYHHDGLGFMSKPDLVLADKDGNNWYIEYKSTKSKKDEWVQQWDTAVQVHSTVKALEQVLNESVQGVIVVGLYKGYESYGKQNSPFCYCYKKNGNPPFTFDQIEYEYKPGFRRYPTWEMNGGVKAWVEGMPDTILGNQFPMTPPILVNDDLIASFFRQRATRENEIEIANEILKVTEDPAHRQIVMDTTFPQRFDQCFPGYGRPCTYVPLCHGGRDPFSNGFQWRDTTHLQPFTDLLPEPVGE
jgi:hypothetical protein